MLWLLGGAHPLTRILQALDREEEKQFKDWNEQPDNMFTLDSTSPSSVSAFLLYITTHHTPEKSTEWHEFTPIIKNVCLN